MNKYKSVEVVDFARHYKIVDLFNEDVVYLDDLSFDYEKATTPPIYVNAFTYFFVEQGEVYITVNDKSYILSQNNIAILSPSHLFKINEIKSGTKQRLLFINELLYGQQTFRNKLYYQLLLYKNPIVHLEQNEAKIISQSFDLIVQRLRDKNHYFQKAAIQVAIFGYLLELSNIIRHNEKLINSSGSKSDNTFRIFAESVMKHYKTQHNISFYANKLNMSPQNLSIVIKGITGNTASNFIYERLYHEARILLHHPEMTIQQIADELHFSDQSSFGKFFKKKSGESPTQFRRKHMK